MILSIYQKRFDDQNFEGVEYIALCGSDSNSPYGDIILQCLEQICLVHIRIYRPTKENIDALKIDLNVFLKEQAKNKLGYSFVATGEIDLKIFNMFKDSIIKEFRLYQPTDANVFLIALDDIEFKEDVKRIE